MEIGAHVRIDTFDPSLAAIRTTEEPTEKLDGVTSFIPAFSPREKEPPLPLSLPLGETDTSVPVRAKEWAMGED